MSESAKRLSDTIVSWIGVIALILGGGFGLCKYNQELKQQKSVQSLKLLDKYDKNPIFHARSELLRFSRLPEVQTAFKKKAASSEFESFLTEAKSGRKYEDYHLGENTFTLLEFYKRVAICANHDVCNADLAKLFFAENIFTFMTFYYPYIQEIKTEMNDAAFDEPITQFILKS